MSIILCPCGSGRSHGVCCGPYHGGTAAPDAESLMRSRYSAFVMGMEAYLLETWHPETRPVGLGFDQAPPPNWQGLVIKSFMPQDAQHATVEFVARYKINGRAYKTHETSRFERIAGRWLYVDGKSEP